MRYSEYRALLRNLMSVGTVTLGDINPGVISWYVDRQKAIAASFD